MQKAFLVISVCVKKYLFIGIMLIVVSCGEESIHDSAGNKSAVIDDLSLIVEEDPSIPKFSDISEIEAVLLMNNEKRLSFEKLNGYESFYRKSMEVYKKFDFSNVKSVSEIERFVAENAQFVEIITNNNGENEFLPKLFYDPFKYIVSEEKVFYFKDNKYDISEFEDDGVINFENMIAEYPELDEFSKFDESSHSIMRSAYSPCAFNSSKNETWTDEDGPHRMKCTFMIWGTGSNLLWHHRYHYSFHQRILGIWGLASGTGGFGSNSYGYTTGHTNYFEYDLFDWDSENVVTWEHNFSTNIGQNWNFEDAVFIIYGALATFFHTTTSFFEHTINCMIPYYGVSFNLNGASGTPPTTQTVGHGDYATKPSPDPNRTGYSFGGWYTNSAGTGSAFNFSSQIKYNTYLYAKWLSPTLSGPTSVNINSNITIYANNAPSGITWSCSSNLTEVTGSSVSRTYKANSESSATVSIFLNGSQIAKLDIIVYPANFPIVGTDQICYGSPGTYTLTNGQTATSWQIQPSHMFTITYTSTSAKVEPISNHGVTGSLIVVVGGQGYIKYINTCK